MMYSMCVLFKGTLYREEVINCITKVISHLTLDDDPFYSLFLIYLTVITGFTNLHWH